ncbi:Gfo/Idh/MocA family protein [Stenotrophomonas forensis]|uniref:Gfo/Idh/MocA family protein n=1 Tax=Stenotrophomonas forensis TaxID=2871169 RepID=UPI0039C6CE81
MILDNVAWGFIGCGSVTETKSGPALAGTPGSRVAAVMRRNAALAGDYARRHAIPRWYADADALIADPEVNAIYVATPPSTHMQYALQAIAAGKPVYIEKPMAMDHGECVRILDASARSGVPVFVAYYRRALPRFAKVKQLLDSGAIGTPRSVRATLHRPHSVHATSPDFWRTNPAISGGGLFVDLGSHTLDLLDHLLGPLGDVSGLASSQAGAYAAEDSVSMCFRTGTGAHGIAQWSFCAFRRQDEIDITGDRGQLRFATFEDVPVLLETDAGMQAFEIPNPPSIQQPLIATLVDELRGHGRSPSTGLSATRTNAVIDQVLQAYRARQ